MSPITHYSASKIINLRPVVSLAASHPFSNSSEPINDSEANPSKYVISSINVLEYFFKGTLSLFKIITTVSLLHVKII